MGKSYCSQVFLEKYIYIVKEKEVIRHFTENLEIYSNDSYESDKE